MGIIKMKDKKPHVIYIISDEHRGQAMAHTGDKNLKTPNLDRLASEGVSFGRAYCNCPVCTPSRGTIFSGRHAHAGPIATASETFKASFPSIAHQMRKAGYHTAYFGKWHGGMVRDQNPPEVRANIEDYPGSCNRTPERHRAGFQDWRANEHAGNPFKSFYYHDREINPRKLEDYDTDGFTDMVIDYLQNYDKEEPLFLVLSVMPPHFPFLVPEKFKRINPEDLALRPNFNPAEFHGEEKIKEMLAIYYAMIENLDENIGKLMTTIENLPQFKNTLTVYFSDHGEYLGCHHFGVGKAHPHEESLRIPMIFHWPEKIPPTGINDDCLISLVDLQATILGLINTEKPIYDQGTDCSAAILGNNTISQETILVEMSGNTHGSLHTMDWRGVVTKDWKYAFYENGYEVMYNLAEDPFEMNNLAGKDPEKQTQLKELLLKQLRETREPFFDVMIEHGITPEHRDIDVSLDPDFVGLELFHEQ